MKLFAKALALSVAIGSAAAFADTGGLRVKIVDETGSAISGITVSISTPESLTKRQGVTDANGEVKLIGLDPSSKYVVAVQGEGYQRAERQNVRVVSGQTFSVSYALEPTGVSTNLEEVVVMGRAVQMVDTTSATVGQAITLDLTESLPTQRSYQDYLQLVPGVKPSASGNPASKSGVNYSDAIDADGDTSGTSTDNLYYIDGVNITDNATGTFGANFNSEIIQEQHVLTGGIPAEYEGGSGLISRVITKSGSNEFQGSVNYYTQSDALVSDNKHLDDASFSTFDTAFTFGGPIIKDKVWFYTSFQMTEREDDVVDAVSGEGLRTVKRESDLGFAKLTWQITDNDKLMVSFFNDPTDISGNDQPDVLNNRDYSVEEGGDNYQVEYSHTWDNVIVTLNAARHEGQLSRYAKSDITRNDVAYLAGEDVTNADLSLGGRGRNDEDYRNKETYDITLQWFLDTAIGSHEIKAGYTFTDNERRTVENYSGDGSNYTSIGARHSGTSLGDYAVGSKWQGSTDLIKEDFKRILDAMGNSTDRDYYSSLLDENKDGEISGNELENLTFDSAEGNPNDQINVYRIQYADGADAEINVGSEGNAFYLQDTWSYNNWAVSAGVRMEEWTHFGSDGREIHSFDYEIAPRFSVAYDIGGEGLSKVWAFAGRYYDPIRTDMTDFAGIFSQVRDEQVFVGDRWLTFRSRGNSDAIFAPDIKTPYTDEYLIGYSRFLTDTISAEIIYTQRETKDLMEDYDLEVYGDPNTAGDFFLPLSYFGFSEDPGTNYIIGTLKGGKREYEGVELTLRRERVDNWQMLASYTYNLAKGNSNSDGNADFQGDVLWLDPRAPNVWGDQPGNIEHMFKLAGSYTFSNGIEIGAVYRWNSGLLYNRAFETSGRHLPSLVEDKDKYVYGGVSDTWVKEGSVGVGSTPSYGTLDLRAKYTLPVGDYEAEFFIDMFNVLDDQSVIREQALTAGDAVYKFGEGSDWVEPRRLYLGARMSF